MIATGIFTAAFGIGYFLDIHSLAFYVIMQVKLHPFEEYLKVIGGHSKVTFSFHRSWQGFLVQLVGHVL